MFSKVLEWVQDTHEIIKESLYDEGLRGWFKRSEQSCNF